MHIEDLKYRAPIPLSQKEIDRVPEDAREAMVALGRLVQDVSRLLEGHDMLLVLSAVVTCANVCYREARAHQLEAYVLEPITEFAANLCEDYDARMGLDSNTQIH